MLTKKQVEARANSNLARRLRLCEEYIDNLLASGFRNIPVAQMLSAADTDIKDAYVNELLIRIQTGYTAGGWKVSRMKDTFVFS